MPRRVKTMWSRNGVAGFARLFRRAQTRSLADRFKSISLTHESCVDVSACLVATLAEMTRGRCGLDCAAIGRLLALTARRAHPGTAEWRKNIKNRKTSCPGRNGRAVSNGVMATSSDACPFGAEPPAAGDWGDELARHRGRLRRMIELRLDRRLRGRVDASDVIQEAYLEAARRRDEYLAQPSPMPFFLWLRFLTAQTLQALHRRHLGVQARDVGREVSIAAGRVPEATSAAIAARLLGRDTGASNAAIRAERKLRLERALNAMDPLDREVLALRHFEQLSNSECARVLELNESAATKRYVRALKRLKEILTALPDSDSEAWR
jgi:RNA polymerase sigma-70 factor, ECF subfamily